MKFFRCFICRFRQLPPYAIVLAVLSRFVFGFGLGALLASRTRANWRAIGWYSILAGTGLVVPPAVKILRSH